MRAGPGLAAAIASRWACDQGARAAAVDAGLTLTADADGARAPLAFRPGPTASALVSRGLVKSAGSAAAGTAVICPASSRPAEGDRRCSALSDNPSGRQHHQRPVEPLVFSAVVLAITLALAILLVAHGGVRLWELAALQVPSGAAASFLFPAMNSLFPQTVPEKLRRKATAVSRTGMNLALICGPAAAGVAVATVGYVVALGVNALCYVLACSAFVRVSVPRIANRGPGRSLLKDLAEGWDAFRLRRWLWTAVLGFSLVNVCMAVGFETLGPLLAADFLGGAGSWGTIVAAQGVGLVVGAAAAGQWRPTYPLRVGWTAVLLTVPAFAALALHAPVLLVATAAFSAGVGLEVFGLNWDTTLQREIPSAQLSRVYSYDALASNGSIPLGQVALVPAAAFVGTDTIVWAAGVLVLLTAVVAVWAARTGFSPRADVEPESEARPA